MDAMSWRYWIVVLRYCLQLSKILSYSFGGLSIAINHSKIWVTSAILAFIAPPLSSAPILYGCGSMRTDPLTPILSITSRFRFSRLCQKMLAAKSRCPIDPRSRFVHPSLILIQASWSASTTSLPALYRLHVFIFFFLECLSIQYLLFRNALFCSTPPHLHGSAWHQEFVYSNSSTVPFISDLCASTEISLSFRFLVLKLIIGIDKVQVQAYIIE